MALIEDYLINTVPWGKQVEAFATVTDPTRKYGGELTALIMEQRTGKTPVAIAKVAHHYVHCDVDAMMVVAMPSGVPRNWAAEIELRLNPSIPRRVVVWDAGRARTKTFQDDLRRLLGFPGLSVLLVNGEAVLTEPFRAYAAVFLRRRKCFAIVDETSLVIRQPGNKRSKILNGARPLTRFRMILDGTPAGESPLDLYSQYGWLTKDILGQPTALAFRNHYAQWEKKVVHERSKTDPKKMVEREYPSIKVDETTGEKMYQHLDEMKERIDAVSFFCTRDQCFDIPPKVYTRYEFDLTKPQRNVYDELRETYRAELRTGKVVTARMVLVRYLRLQQVGSNFWPSEKHLTPCIQCAPENEGCEACDFIGSIATRTDPVVIDPAHDARITALEEVLSVEREPVIIWARFTRDVDATMETMRRLGRKPVQYDGRISADEKEHNRLAFQRGLFDGFVANQGAGQRGIDASAAKAAIYFSNTYSGLQRQQTEDRTEVSGRTRGTGIIDLVAADTVDEDIVTAHRTKRSVSDVIMGRVRAGGDYFGGSR